MPLHVRHRPQEHRFGAGIRIKYTTGSGDVRVYNPVWHTHPQGSHAPRWVGAAVLVTGGRCLLRMMQVHQRGGGVPPRRYARATLTRLRNDNVRVHQRGMTAL